MAPFSSPANRLRAARIQLVRRLPRFLRRRLRPISLTVIALLVMIQIIALQPAPIEQSDESVAAVDPRTLVPASERTLAQGVPKDTVPDYSIEAFTHVSTQSGEKQWKLVAEKAYLYNGDKLVHARRIKAFLYDPDGKTTLVTGREAKYHMNGRDLEIFGDVKTTFSDGFEVDSEYLRHSPEGRRIDIPETYAVRGNAQQARDQKIAFTSHGLAFDMAKAQITLLRDAKVTSLESPTATSGGTTIESDRCVIYRDRQQATFRMNSTRPLKTQFVHITQPTMFSRARRADLSYGNFSKILNYLVLHEDVLVKETGSLRGTPTSLRYATGGKAEFDAHKDLVVMTEFPQVYQDQDTVTGDVIRLYRDSDVIEVEHSNAFSQGTN